MRTLTLKTLGLFLLLSPLTVLSQKSYFSEKEEVIHEAKSQLVGLCSEGGDLQEFCVENQIKGEFVIDLTLQGKGKVLTVFMVSSSAEDVQYQNLLKSKLTGIEFTNIKIPKNERIKFRQTLTF
jgi:hypothetical protein